MAAIEARLISIERRLSLLEGATEQQSLPGGEDLQPSLGDGLVSNLSTNIGRALLIFGGAYLLRAITDFQFVPTSVGLLMGAIYAVAWLLVAYRRARGGVHRASAAFFAGASVLLALPLLFESVTKFDLLTGQWGVFALGVYFAAASLIARARNLHSLAWLVTAGSIGAAVALFTAVGAGLSAASFLLFVGLVTLWIVYGTGWIGLQWLGAAGANLGAISLLAVSQSDRWTITPRVAAVFALTVLLVYFLSFVIRTEAQRRSVAFFEPAQFLVGGSIALWACIRAVAAAELSILGVGIAVTVFGVLCYGFALRPRTRAKRTQNYFFYSALGLVLVLLGTGVTLPMIWAASTWCLLALVTAWQSGRRGWVTLSLQCTLLIVAAGIGSGLLATGLQAFVAGADGSWPAFLLPHAGIALTTVACLFLPVAQSSERWGVLAGLPQLIVLTLSVWEVGGLFVVAVAPVIAGAGGAEPVAAVMAALRTAVLSVASVTLALSSRHRRWPEARWLVYPVLIVVAVKLFVEDFPNGQPASLFVALVFVGSALLIVSRFLKRSQTAA